MATLDLLQRIDHPSPGVAAFGQRSSRAEELYISRRLLTADEINRLLLDIMGDVEVGTGRLLRTLPMAHPVHPWLFADTVEIRGYGHKDADGNTGDIQDTYPSLEAPAITDQWWRYVRTAWKVTFVPRPYAIIADGEIRSTSLSWTDFDGSTVSSTDSTEYTRYTDPELEPQIPPAVAYVQQGHMWFATGTGAAPGGTTPHSFSGHPSIMLPDGVYKLTWYHVPYSLFLDGSHPMWRYVGRVNQTAFMGQGPGRLLYLGPRAVRFTPIVPFLDIAAGTIAFSSAKFCDITFHFLYTGRDIQSPPSTGNANWIAAGHNALPWAQDRKFYYGRTTDTGLTPQYFSFPAQLLFKV